MSPRLVSFTILGDMSGWRRDVSCPDRAVCEPDFPAVAGFGPLETRSDLHPPPCGRFDGRPSLYGVPGHGACQHPESESHRGQ